MHSQIEREIRSLRGDSETTIDSPAQGSTALLTNYG